MKKFKRTIAGVLLATMLLALLPTGIFAASGEHDSFIFAYYSNEQKLDGALSDIVGGADTLTRLGDISLGALWNTEMLMLQIANYVPGTELKFGLGGKTLTLAPSGDLSGIANAELVTGYAMEIRVPLADAGIKLYDLEQIIELSVSVSGRRVFSGGLRFSTAMLSKMDASMFDLVGGVTGHTVSRDSGLSYRANAGATGRSYLICQKNDILSNHEGIGVISMNIDAKKVPIFYDAPLDKADAESARICDGLSFGVNYNVPENVGYSFNLTNIKDIGLCIVFHTDNHGAVTLPLDKQSGEKFRLYLEHDFEGRSIRVYADGKYIGEARTLYTDSLWGKNTVNQLSTSIWTETMPSEFNVNIDNILVGNIENNSIKSYISESLLIGNNISARMIVEDLELVDSIKMPYLTDEIPLSYKSSDPSVIDPETGRVTRPEKGTVDVTLTVVIENIGEKKFELTVFGVNESVYAYFVVKKDIAPATGRGVPHNGDFFTLDANNNSVVIDLGGIKEINTVCLNDTDSICRLNRESLSLWVSDDNKTYTEVEDFKLLRSGKQTYLYGFEAKGRYIKAHYTHFDTADSDFTALLSGMVLAYYEDVFGTDAERESLKNVKTTVENEGGEPIRDGAVELSLSELGIKDNRASIRVYMDGELLYHYTEGDSLVVRVPHLSVGESAELSVYYGAEDALSIENKEAVYEVTYGYRESFLTNNVHRWLFKLPAGTKFPNGEVAEREVLLSWSNTVIYGSYDSGRTWFNYGKVKDGLNKELDGIGDPVAGGFIFDDITGRIFYETHCYNGFNASDMTKSDCINKVLVSDDGGKTFDMADVLEPDTVDGKTFNYCLSYSDGIRVSGYDGEGPNVDFVFPTGAQYNNNGAFCCRVAYSADGGKTWQYSKNLMIYGNGQAFEGGMSEGYILENEDGVLVLHCRCQFSEVTNFAMAYSYDGGRTWTAEKTREAWEAKKDSAGVVVGCILSEMHTPNTQPVMFKYDGAPIFLWGGNNTLGGTSYIRNPLNVAVSYDGLETFENIQNLFSETFHETYLGSDRLTHYITNPSVQKVGEDGLTITFERLGKGDVVHMNVTDFTKYLYLTKGAYDGFDSSTPKYEGWTSYRGTAVNYELNGKSAMALGVNSLTSRSIPYFTEGRISFEVYVDSSTSLTLEFKAAFGAASARDPYISLVINGNSLECGGRRLTLENGWNTVELDIKDIATISLNGAEPKSIRVNSNMGDYICYAIAFANSQVLLDSFLVEEYSDAEVYLTEEDRAEVDGLIKDIDALYCDSDPATEADIQKARDAYEAMTVSMQLEVHNIGLLDKIGTEGGDEAHSHTLTHHPKEEVHTCLVDICHEYWFCDECGKYFTDAMGTTEVEREDLICHCERVHDFDDGVIDGDKMIYTCNMCGITRTRIIEATDTDKPGSPDPVEGEDTTEPEENKGGCGSAVSGMGMLALMIPMAVAVKRKKKEE